MIEESQNKFVGLGSMPLDKEYAQWIAELAKRYRSSQIKSSIKVNDEMLRFYWSVGEDIERRKYENRYGSHFYENVSRDLRHVLGLKRGLSPTTIKYTHYFYCLYNQALGNRQGVVDDSLPVNRQQGVDEFEMLFLVPWSHHTRIIDKVKGDGRKGLFFVRKSLENNWGRGVLICKEKNAVLARYALSDMNRPMGISEYEVARQQLPDDLKKALPSTDEIEAGLNRM